MRRSFARVVLRQRNSQLSKLWLNRHDESDQNVVVPRRRLLDLVCGEEVIDDSRPELLLRNG